MEPSDLARCYSAHGAGLVLLARQWLRGGSAEDVVQEVFIRLMAQRTEPRNVKAWLYRAVRNAAISQLRSHSRRVRHEQERAARQPLWFEHRPELPLDVLAVQEALSRLPVEQREIIVMRLWGGLTLQEAAEATGEAVSTLFSRYRTGLAMLRERLGASCNHRTD
jgi:RNA polymerase sigma-70 factor (ECF subfamily)